MGRIVKGLGRVVPAVALDARAEAAALLASAKAAREEARQAGHAAGLAQGRAEARAEAARALESATPAAIALGRKMAERIVGRAIALDPTVMAEIVAAALEASRPRGAAVRVRLHPEDLDAVAVQRTTLAARTPTAADIELIPDPSVGRSGCIVETPMGRVDARLDAQLEALERALRELHA